MKIICDICGKQFIHTSKAIDHCANKHPDIFGKTLIEILKLFAEGKLIK
jgi:hypothetical protein